jgi:hypothetical protein
MIDDEAVEDARRKMDAFQAVRGLIGATDAAKRIKEWRAEIGRLERSAKQKGARPGRRSPQYSLICAAIGGRSRRRPRGTGILVQ